MWSFFCKPSLLCQFLVLSVSYVFVKMLQFADFYEEDDFLKLTGTFLFLHQTL